MPIYTKDIRVQLAQERGIVVDEQDMWWIENFTWSLDNVVRDGTFHYGGYFATKAEAIAARDEWLAKQE